MGNMASDVGLERIPDANGATWGAPPVEKQHYAEFFNTYTADHLTDTILRAINEQPRKLPYQAVIDWLIEHCAVKGQHYAFLEAAFDQNTGFLLPKAAQLLLQGLGVLREKNETDAVLDELQMLDDLLSALRKEQADDAQQIDHLVKSDLEQCRAIDEIEGMEVVTPLPPVTPPPDLEQACSMEDCTEKGDREHEIARSRVHKCRRRYCSSKGCQLPLPCHTQLRKRGGRRKAGEVESFESLALVGAEALEFVLFR